jgi:hypothetical protein
MRAVSPSLPAVRRILADAVISSGVSASIGCVARKIAGTRSSAQTGTTVASIAQGNRASPMTRQRSDDMNLLMKPNPFQRFGGSGSLSLKG